MEFIDVITIATITGTHTINIPTNVSPGRRTRQRPLFGASESSPSLLTLKEHPQL